ncbi:MAG: GTP cyclohydrolase MptA [Nitrososphaerota archaeon]|nr:GTP cyclohydrolase MptA [Candidatus Geocrenenecus dongiae]
METLPNIHDEKPDIPIPINKVGFKDVWLPILKTTTNNGELILSPRFTVLVDLNQDRRGIHVSRIYEVVSNVVEEVREKNVKLDDVCREIAKRILSSHQSSSRVYIEVKSPTFYKTTSPITKLTSYEKFDLYVKIEAWKNDLGELEFSKTIGVEVKGLNTCPCAREVVKTVYKPLDTTHMQRVKVKFMIEIPENCQIDFIDILEIVKSSFSSPIYSLLKKIDEAKVIIEALNSPKFIEDILREILKKVIEKWSNLSYNSKIYIEVESEESMHPYNLVASTKIDVGSVKRLLGRS